MSIEHETGEGIRLLSGLENGNLTTANVYNIAEKRDPILVYFILRYLREKYPAQNPTSQGVATRLLELSSTYDDIVKMCKESEKDPMREWFDDTYEMREFFSKADQFVEMIVNKLES